MFWTRIGLPDGAGLPDLVAVANGTEVVPVDGIVGNRLLAMASELGADVLERARFLVELPGGMEEGMPS